MTHIEDFERERPRLVGLAYRMLGTLADAEDVVQETFLRWRGAGSPHLENPRAWLTRTCTRLCLDQLKSARRQREEYVGEWLPEPYSTDEPERRELDDTLSMALLMTVQRLRPPERAAFLLHDVFGYTFREVAEILDLQPAYCRKLAASARKRLKGEAPSPESDERSVRRLSEAFFGALRSGSLDGLKAVLAQDVVLRTDGGGKVAAARRPIEGIDAVSRFFHRIFNAYGPNPDLETRALWFNGAPGILVYEQGRVVSAFQFRVIDHRIDGIFVQRNPDKLRRLQSC